MSLPHCTTVPEAQSPGTPRPEYPRPQFARQHWLSLNGTWEFEADPGDSGLERGLLERPLAERIRVPFCIESRLSGLGRTDFTAAVWYRRKVTVPAHWPAGPARLHFQACDYDTTVWVDGVEAVRHRGGFTPFGVDLPSVRPGQELLVVVRARDDHRPPQPRGKQSQRLANHGGFYTRTTGIWQTVWLEPLPTTHFLRPRIRPDLGRGGFQIEIPLRGPRSGGRVRASLHSAGQLLAEAAVPADANFSPSLWLPVPEAARRTWQPQHPQLLDLKFEYTDSTGRTVDTLWTYAGLRSLGFRGASFLLNGRPLFQRLVLDQGYYEDGILTAPSDEALRRDIELSMAAGFNGARLHQKVFEERFLFWADVLGYLCWGEFPDWGCGGYGPHDTNQQPTLGYVSQWLEAIDRDQSHPCIVGWCALNETGQPLHDQITTLDDATRALWLAAKLADPTRPVLDASGWSHRVSETDVWDTHDYEQDPVKLAAHHARTAEGTPHAVTFWLDQNRPQSIPYGGQPVFVSEFGGIRLDLDAAKAGADAWGYGAPARSVPEFLARFDGLCRALLSNPGIFGYCYTQLTDVFLEHNGVYTFDRQAKADTAALRAAQTHPAATELPPTASA